MSLESLAGAQWVPFLSPLRRERTRTAVTLLASLWLAAGALAQPMHGIAMHGEPALPPDFTHLPYADPEAPKGGILRQALTSSFDSLSPFIVKGKPAVGVRTYVIESLLARNGAEPFSLYGLLAESIDVSDDRQTIIFTLRPGAAFSDGKPVTSADVVFSLETLRDHGLPHFKTSYGKVKSIETPDEHTVVFRQDAGDRELPLILGLMPILPKHFWERRNFEATTLDPLLGSGPYVIAEVKPGEAIVYRRNPHYWGQDLPIARGLWNFDEVHIDYYRDSNAAFEAFKTGLADIRIEADPVRWSGGYDFPAAKQGRVVKESIEQKTPASASGFVFNTRRRLFADGRVREALVMAFDFEWANANLFSNLYHRTYGYFSGSELSSAGVAANAAELAIIGDEKTKLSPAILDGTYALPKSDGSGRDRKILRAALSLLGEAGWHIAESGLTNAAGEPFAFTLAIQSKEQERIALHYQRSLRQIGIDMQVRIVDSAQFARMQQTYDFDMIPMTLYNSLSPGNEQVSYYGSTSRDQPGTRNYAGVADPAVDRAIAAMLRTDSRKDFVPAVRALDRTLVAGFYMVPFYDAGHQWVARWSHIGKPAQQPLTGFEATSLWRKPQ